MIKQWLDGDTRDKIAYDNQIGAGTVSGIMNEFKKRVNALEYESVRELSISCKKHGINLGKLSSCIRLNNHIQKLGANREQIEILITNLANSPEPEKLIDVANQIVYLSRSDSIPLEDIENHIEQQIEEKQRPEEEIKQRRAILESTNIYTQTLNEYKKLKEELYIHGLSLKYPHVLLSILKTIREIGYGPQKIVNELNNRCKLEFRLDRYKDVLPLCEQIVGLRIGIGELLAFDTAVY